MLILNFEGREVKGLSKGRYDETFAGKDGNFRELLLVKTFLAFKVSDAVLSSYLQ